MYVDTIIEFRDVMFLNFIFYKKNTSTMSKHEPIIPDEIFILVERVEEPMCKIIRRMIL